MLLVSAVQKSESAACIHISPLFWRISFPSLTTERWVEFLELYHRFSFISVQFSSVSQLYLTVTLYTGHTSLPCPSPSPGVCSNSCPSNWWCHPTISSSVVLFSSCLQSFPASGSFPVSQFFTSGGQSIGVSASTSVLPMNIQDWFPLGWTDLISSLSKVLSRGSSNTTVQKHQFFCAQLSLWSKSLLHTWLLEKPWLWLDGPLLAK